MPLAPIPLAELAASTAPYAGSDWVTSLVTLPLGSTLSLLIPTFFGSILLLMPLLSTALPRILAQLQDALIQSSHRLLTLLKLTPEQRHLGLSGNRSDRNSRHLLDVRRINGERLLYTNWPVAPASTTSS